MSLPRTETASGVDWLERIGERLNPILVKEARQALRGRWFKVSFVVTLVIATVASVGMFEYALRSQTVDELGSTYFFVLFGCLSLATNALLPFQAMMSMSAEAQENSLEMLQLSGLAPWRIVLGKLLAMWAQAGLFIAAFSPFLACTILLRGVDPLGVLQSLCASMLYCGTLGAIGVFLGTLARVRWARTLLLIGFAAFLFQGAHVVLLLTVFTSALGSPAGAPGSTAYVVGMLVLAFVLCASFVLAAARLAHFEENQSTPMRVALTGFVVACVAGAAFLGTPEGAWGTILTAMIATMIYLLFAATERESLPRAARVPRSALGAACAAPWLPGGGRGILLGVLLLGFLASAFAMLGARATLGSGKVLTLDLLRLAILAAWTLAILGFSSLVGARFADRLGARIVVRLGVIVVTVSGLILGPLLEFLGAPGLIVDLTFVLNPLVLLVRAASIEDLLASPGVWTIFALCALAIAGNSRRMSRGLRDVASASARRRTAEGRHQTESHAASVA